MLERIILLVEHPTSTNKHHTRHTNYPIYVCIILTLQFAFAFLLVPVVSSSSWSNDRFAGVSVVLVVGAGVRVAWVWVTVTVGAADITRDTQGGARQDTQESQWGDDTHECEHNGDTLTESAQIGDSCFEVCSFCRVLSAMASDSRLHCRWCRVLAR